jgi:hypothetical protein
MERKKKKMKIDGREIIETSLNRDRFMRFVNHCNGFGEPIAAFTITISNRSWTNKAHIIVTNKALILDIPEDDRVTSFKFSELLGSYGSFEARFESYKSAIMYWLKKELSLCKSTIENMSFRYELSNMVNIRLFDLDQFVHCVAVSLEGDPFMVGGDKSD